MNQDKINPPAFTKVHFDFDNLSYLTSPRQQLNLQAVGIGLIQLPPDEGYTFTHSHAEQEEVYIVVAGRGLILVDGELIEIKRGDLIRVSPPAKRALKAAKDTNLFVICAGGVAADYPHNPTARYLIDDGIPDYDDIPPWYEDRPDIAERNAKLKARMLKAKTKREQQ
ncbi:MAG: cupin domain-containing protein [Nostocaceae cyanobacterium]|nr:cupin domain-containing protein [Nostocaceae cyanobacterium]